MHKAASQASHARRRLTFVVILSVFAVLVSMPQAFAGHPPACRTQTSRPDAFLSLSSASKRASSRASKSASRSLSSLSQERAAQGSTQKAAVPKPDRSGMVFIPGGTFEMGCRGCGLADALPLHLVTLSPYWLDATPTTNAAYAQFVRASGYLSIAEQALDPKDYPGIAVRDLVPGSAVFSPPKGLRTVDPKHSSALSWWQYRAGASWRHPEGPASDWHARAEHPVVHIAFADAVTFCQWVGKRLPTEAEFEFAARGGLAGKKYAWGDELKPKGAWAANIWQGDFPLRNTSEDGYEGSSPVKAFPANGFGLYDMGGNVWQWTADWYRADTYAQRGSGKTPVVNPQGPSSSFDPNEAGTAKRVQRGGSYLCSDHYCTRYLVGSRGKGAIDSAGSNVGFRCAQDVSTPPPR